MDKTFQTELEAVGNGALTAGISDECKRTVPWCIEGLPDLYAKFRQTSEHRYIEEITRFVQGMLKELATGKKAGPGAHQLALHIMERFQLLHEDFGFPRLNLKPLGVPPPRSRKVRQTDDLVR